MLFNSPQFLLFFPVVTAGYFLLPHRFRLAWLLAASCLFYMAFVPAYIAILGATIGVDYVAGILIEDAPTPRKRVYLAMSLLTNVGALAVFKYANFAIDNTNAILAFVEAPWAVPVVHVVLPIGLSFHTFQAMAYSIEVYKKRQTAERHFGLFALYVMFWPQLVAGPIERPQNILPQLKTEHSFVYAEVVDGLKVMAWGFFQKVVVADRLSRISGPIFDHPREYHGVLLIVGAVAFTFQIYFDFAAYSEIASGAAQVMGIRLMTNFHRPFHATSIAEFWSRWHISLTTWFRDYLYIPLGGNRVSTWRRYMNLMTVFLVSGLWHGANWTFVAWGSLNGIYLIGALVLAPYRPKILADNTRLWVRTWNVASVFALVCVAFVFFRAKTIADAAYILGHIPIGLAADLRALARYDVHAVFGGHANLPGLLEWLIVAGGLAVTQAVHLGQRRGSMWIRLSCSPAWIRWPIYAGLAYAPLIFANSESVRFIYFQF